MRSTPLARGSRWATAVLTALLAALAWTAAAHAEPVTYDDPGTSGASVTLSSDRVVPGERIEISGAGFHGGFGTGTPLVAIKPNDLDLPWSYGGASAYTGTDDAPIWFETAADGSFSGWVEVPANLPRTGPGTGPNAGRHWLRILSGAFSTGTSLTQPITFEAFFSVADRVTLSLQGMTGTHFPAGANVAASGAGFAADAPVEVTLDGEPHPSASITTEADGRFPAGAVVAIPADAAPGPHTLGFATGAISELHEITVTPPATATVLTPRVRPGGTLAVALEHFIGVTGAGQKVAVKLREEDPVACFETDATGSTIAHLPVAADAAPGSTSMLVLAGTSCAGGPAVTDAPGRALFPAWAIAADAPGPSVPARAAVGEALLVEGSGFAAGATLTLALDGAALGAPVVADGDGAFSRSVPIAPDAALGHRLLTVLGDSGGAAREIELVAAPQVALAASSVVAGGTLGVTLTGWRRGDGAGGQKVAITLGDQPLACVATDAEGAAQTTVTLPADTPAGTRTLRFAAGSSCVAGGVEDDLPVRSLPRDILVEAAAAPEASGGGGSGGGVPNKATPVVPAPDPAPAPPDAPPVSAPPPPARESAPSTTARAAAAKTARVRGQRPRIRITGDVAAQPGSRCAPPGACTRRRARRRPSSRWPRQASAAPAPIPCR